MGKITKFKPRRNYNAFMARQNNAVGKKIGEARKEAKLTQGEFAAKLSEYGVDVKTPAVNKWEHGENILKFIEGVELVDGEVTVRFKAGVTVEVELPERRFQAKNPLMVE